MLLQGQLLFYISLALGLDFQSRLVLTFIEFCTDLAHLSVISDADAMRGPSNQQLLQLLFLIQLASLQAVFGNCFF